MTTNTMQKAVEASNFNDPHTDTNGVNSPTEGATKKRIKAAIGGTAQ
jgi:hypothetical protein